MQGIWFKELRLSSAEAIYKGLAGVVGNREMQGERPGPGVCGTRAWV